MEKYKEVIELLKEFSSEGKSKGPQTDSFSEKLKRFWKRD